MVIGRTPRAAIADLKLLLLSLRTRAGSKTRRPS